MNTNCYVYRLYDTVMGKYYIGSNYNKSCEPKDIGTSYFTSSKIVRPMFRTNPERFIIEILFVGVAEEVLKFETETLKRLDARNDLQSYNCHNNENNLNSKKVGELTKQLGIGVHGRSAEKIKQDVSKAGRISSQIRHSVKDSDGKSVFAKLIGKKSHIIRDERGKSVRMVSVGKETMKKLHAQKDEHGKSYLVMVQYECLECGYTHIAMMVGKHQKKTGHVGKKKRGKNGTR